MREDYVCDSIVRFVFDVKLSALTNIKMVSLAVTQWWERLGILDCWRIFFRRTTASNVQNVHDEDTTIGVAATSAISNEFNTTTRIPRHKYGELVKVGYNGGNVDRGKSRYVLYQRFESNGVKISKQYEAHVPAAAVAQSHSISYVLSPKKAVIVEYANDSETDMFQIGRSSKPVIDFHVSNFLPVDKTNTKFTTFLSRYGCRILIKRSDASAKLFAAGFDSNREIFLGEKATKWEDNGQMDGVTTNGVLIMHPKGVFSSGMAECGEWRECSVGGNVLHLRKSRFAQERTEKIPDEASVLKDGTLIDLCGVTLIWRSAEGLKNSPTKSDIEKYMVGLNTLLMPREATATEPIIQPYYFVQCGHTQFFGELEPSKTNDERRCTMCLTKGQALPLRMGIEPAFYVDFGPPTFAFSPCGHMASERTVKYWASVNIPKDRKEENNDFKAACPFCRTLLSDSPGYVNLKFQIKS